MKIVVVCDMFGEILMTYECFDFVDMSSLMDMDLRNVYVLIRFYKFFGCLCLNLGLEWVFFHTRSFETSILWMTCD